jgi:fatty acid desaturase
VHRRILATVQCTGRRVIHATARAGGGDHNRVTMAAAPRARPEDHFTPDQWRALIAKSRWRGLWLVAHCWGVIGLAMAVGARWPWLCVMVIGTRQLGLAILMHDAAHALLHSDRRINDWVGHWLCAPTLKAYRPYHLTHHRHVQQSDDPDLVLSAPFPVSPASLRRKMWRDLSGQTFYKQRLQPLWNTLRGLGGNAGGSDGESAFGGRDLRFLVANALGFAVFAAAGWWWVWLTMWLLPMACWLPLVTRLRNIAEHALVAVDEPDPLRQARTTRATWLERAFIAPYWVNYHAEHHMFTQLPCWQLPKAHALLRAAGTTARMEVQPGYRRVLQLATAPRVAAA